MSGFEKRFFFEAIDVIPKARELEKVWEEDEDLVKRSNSITQKLSIKSF